MTEENETKQGIENDELICPITLELFHDPVKANDGHVYERHAITRWILEHGTSPLTRQPLNINDLQSDERLKDLAKQRRNSTVSYNVQNEKVRLPPLRINPRYSHRVAPTQINNSININQSSNKLLYKRFTTIICCAIIPIGIILAIILALKNSNNEILSIYSGVLTTNSPKFDRLNSSNNTRYYYDNIKINILKDGLYEFQSNSSSIDIYVYFYQDYFNYTNINENLLISDDDSGNRNQFYFQYFLKSNIKYILIVTTFNSYITGSFSIYVYGLSIVTFN